MAAGQAAVVAALGDGNPPQGFDAYRVQLAGTMLAHKRRRAVAKVWPATARALGAEFAAAFTAYAEANPLPDGGPGADGRAFVRFFPQRNRAAVRECVLFDATRGGLVVRVARGLVVIAWRGRVRLWWSRH